jgi:hypothetical protein
LILSIFSFARIEPSTSLKRRLSKDDRTKEVGSSKKKKIPLFCDVCKVELYGQEAMVKNFLLSGINHQSSKEEFKVIFRCQQSVFCPVQFHQQNYAQLCQYTQLEFTLNFYAVLCASKIIVNLLAHKNVDEIDPRMQSIKFTQW